MKTNLKVFISSAFLSSVFSSYTIISAQDLNKTDLQPK